MNVPFDFSASYAGTPIVKKLFDATDNTVLTGSGVPVPAAVPFYIVGLSVTVDKAAKVEFGVVTNGGVFTPIYSTQGTQAVAGGIVRQFDCGPLFPNNNTTVFAAVRITGATNPSVVNACGDIQIFANPVIP